MVRKNVVFDSGSAERIAAAVKWVEQFYLDESKDPANYDPDTGLDFSTPPIIVGTFNGVWATDTQASVTWTSSYGTVVTPATNYLAPVGQANEDTVCVIGLFEKLTAEYVLLAAVNDSSSILRGQFDGLWAQNTTSNVTVTVHSTSAVYNATNLFGDVGEEGMTSDCVILQAGDEWILVNAKPVTECIELSKVEPSGNLTLLSEINLTGRFLQSISGSVVTSVACVNGNLTVTTASISDLATSANLSDVIGYTEATVRLSDLANVTTQNLTLPKQEGCS